MKKTLLTLWLCAFTLLVKAQDASVEKSVFGIQTGVLGIWINNESRLSNSLAIRSEIEIDAGIAAGYNYDRNYIITAPVITLEPRWYYNLKKERVNPNGLMAIAEISFR